ncbi:MAG: response regulator transcription factor [Lachnospiraceae bacterium]|nr:response regulator transcription factor [Lachnospiraceae bacterium]
MIGIGVCDDSITFTEEMHRLLCAYEKEHGLDFEIRLYNSAEELLRAMEEKESFELLFLDIEMGGMDGITLGKKLREMVNRVLIVYVSGYDQYLRQLFEVEPFRFCSKPVKKEELYDILERAMERIRSSIRETFRFQYGKNVVNLLCRDILYLESSGRKVVVHTANGSYEYYDKLDHAQALLPSRSFARIHKAYLINMEHVEAFQYEKVAMRDGTILNISEKNRANVRSLFWDYLKEKEHG